MEDFTGQLYHRHCLPLAIEEIIERELAPRGREKTMSHVPHESEPLQPLKFQTNFEGNGFLIYSQSGAVFAEVLEDKQPDFYAKIQDATDMRDPLQKKFFMGTIAADGNLLIDLTRGEILDQGW